MSNPVFNRIDKEAKEGQYAGFGPGQASFPQGYGTASSRRATASRCPTSRRSTAR